MVKEGGGVGEGREEGGSGAAIAQGLGAVGEGRVLLTMLWALSIQHAAWCVRTEEGCGCACVCRQGVRGSHTKSARSRCERTDA